jgi:hypothetical protein
MACACVACICAARICEHTCANMSTVCSLRDLVSCAERRRGAGARSDVPLLKTLIRDASVHIVPRVISKNSVNQAWSPPRRRIEWNAKPPLASLGHRDVDTGRVDWHPLVCLEVPFGVCNLHGAGIQRRQVTQSGTQSDTQTNSSDKSSDKSSDRVCFQMIESRTNSELAA